MTVSQTFPAFNWPWQFCGKLVQYFVGCPSIGCCLMFFLWLNCSYGFWGRNSQRWSGLLPHHNKGTHSQHYLSPLMLTLITCLEGVFFDSPLWSYSFPASLSTLCSLEKSHHAQFTFKEWELCLIFLVWKSYINYFCKGMFFCSLPFIYSIINQINIYFILWVESPILPYFLAPIVPGWALGRSFHQFLCSLDAFPLLWRLLYLLVCF